MISPPVLRALTPDGLFQLESDTSRECVGGTLFQKQGDEWVVTGYHSKRLPASAKNFGVTKLELNGLLVNICDVGPGLGRTQSYKAHQKCLLMRRLGCQLNYLNYSPTEGGGGVQALRSSPG